MSNLTKHLPLLLCFICLTFASNAQEKGKLPYVAGPQKDTRGDKAISKPDYSEPSSLPTDFPKYVDTGNPTADMAKYQSDKSVWYSANPERAKQYIGNQGDKKIMTNDEFQALPEKRKQHVLAHPELYEIK